MKKIIYLITTMTISIYSCNNSGKKETSTSKQDTSFTYQTEQFSDVKIIRYQIPGFDSLSLKQKELLFYLYQAALAGRDIIYDQNFKNNLCIRKTFEQIVEHYSGDTATTEYKNFLLYAKCTWVSNGIHHHYSMDKFKPAFSENYFSGLIKNSKDATFPLEKNETIEALIKKISKIIFDSTVASKRVSLDAEKDMILASACNFYEGVTQKEVEDFYADQKTKAFARLGKSEMNEPVSFGLNSKLVKENNKLTEKTWKVGGMYTKSIEQIVYWLKKAITVAETEQQKKSLEKLVEFYTTGDLKTFDEYSILWLQDTLSTVDVVNGFIEVYGDPLGRKGSFQSVVSIKDLEATKRAKLISEYAQWFEDNSPIDKEFKKKNVKGVSAKVIDVVVESGDCSPTTPIGVNLPNADWIRKDYGSKSVTLGNIVYAYDESSKNNGAIEEFAYSKEEIDLGKKYGTLAGNLHTDLHEIVGHGSGQLKKGVADPSETLKNYASTLEEARADLVALYYLMDQKLVDLKLMPTLDVGKAEYNSYMRNGLMTQLVRLELGKNLEESHMRNRQLIAKWVYEKGRADKVVELKKKDGKTYVVINDYLKLRVLFGQLLNEIQRIKSEGDYKSGKALVEDYGVIVDPVLHKEVKQRWEKLKIAPYSAFINPVLIPVYVDGKITDVKVMYPTDFKEQMLFYGKYYSFLPVYN
jgi:dipeptidyl-peptidase-3